MRILYVINSLDGGGGALPLPHIIGVMRAEGHDVHVVALMERDGRARPLLDAQAIPYEVIGGPKRRYVETAWRLDRIIRARRPDLIWTSFTHATITGQLLGALRRIPVVSWQHNAWLKPINARILRLTAGLTRHWVVDSGAVQTFGEETLGLDPARISIWPLFMADPGTVAAASPASPVFRLGSLGRLHRNKGYDVLVRAVAHLNSQSPDVGQRLSVHLAGEGPERPALEALVHELGVPNIHFEGFTTEPMAFLAGLHGYVQPSHHEGLCIAAHQALAAGLPVIASPVGEMARSVTASNGGILVPYGDVQELAVALERFVRDPLAAADMGRAARIWTLREYSVENFKARGRAALRAAERLLRR